MKYELTDVTKEVENDYGTYTLHQIRALSSFDDVKEGDLGGYIESEANLSQEGKGWLYEDAIAFHNARIRHDAKVRGVSQVAGHASVEDNAIVENSIVCSDAVVNSCAAIKFATIRGDAMITGNAKVTGNENNVEQVEVTGNALISGNGIVSEAYPYLEFTNVGSNKSDITAFVEEGEEPSIAVTVDYRYNTLDYFEHSIIGTEDETEMNKIVDIIKNHFNI